MSLASKKKRPRGGASVPCPDCGSASRAIDTRRSDSGSKVLRSRQCLVCLHVFSSEEVPVPPTRRSCP